MRWIKTRRDVTTPAGDDLARELSLFAKAIEDEITWGLVGKGDWFDLAISSLNQFPFFCVLELMEPPSRGRRFPGC
jgi:hypothetical protein